MEKEKLYKILGVVLVIILFISTAAISFKLGMNHANYEIQSKENETDKKEKDESIEKNPQEESDKKDEQEEPVKDEDKIKIVGTRYEEFDNIVRRTFEEKDLKTVPGYESFYMNRMHTTQPGAWTVGMPDRYIFNDDGTYLFNINDFDIGNTEVVRAGTWEIKNGKLTLYEKYILTRVNGTFIDAPAEIYGENVKEHINYDLEIKQSSTTKSYTIKHIGISSYKQDMNEGENKKIIPDNYKLNEKDWYSLEGNYLDEFGYALKYYDLIK